MKKLSIAFTVALVLAGVACAASNTVVLGYTKITVPADQRVLVSLNYDNENNTVNGLFGNLPVGSSVYIWDTETQNYTVISNEVTGWGPLGTNRIQTGGGVFVTLPAGVQTNMILSGNVPNAETSAVYKATGYTMVSYPYPVLMPFTNTALAKTAVIGDQISVWQNNSWTIYSNTPAGWTGAEDLKMKPGQAFFFRAASSGSATETRPYTID